MRVLAIADVVSLISGPYRRNLRGSPVLLHSRYRIAGLGIEDLDEKVHYVTRGEELAGLLA